MRKTGSSYRGSGDEDLPEIPPEVGIELLQRQIDEAKSLVVSRPIDSQAFSAWCDATKTYLNKAFGKNQKSLSYPTAGLVAFASKGERERSLEEGHFKTLQANIITLAGYIKQLQTEIEISRRSEKGQDTITQVEENISSPHQVFIVHGRNDDAKTKVARFIEKAGLTALILHEQPGGGRTIVEKLEHHSLVGYAVVILTADDVGKGVHENDLRPRARQNVIFELGYFSALLGRNRVSVLCEEGVQIPTDYSGVEYLPLTQSAWQVKLLNELDNAGFKVDFKKALSVV